MPISLTKIRHILLSSPSFVYAAVMFLLLQAALTGFVPLSAVYDYRMDYNVIKDNIVDVDSVLTLLRREIDRQRLMDYIIVLGDSVAYSGPGGPRQSLSYYMEQIAASEARGGAEATGVHSGGARAPVRVFNLAIPAAQMGDFYTMLLKLEERGISTNRLVINISYAGFVRRDPDPPIVYWLERDLERLDPRAYGYVERHLLNATENKNRPNAVESLIESTLYSRVPVLRYRDFIRARLFGRLGVSREVADTRPWRQKPYLRQLLLQPIYQRAFDPSPFVLDEANLNVYFLRLIAARQQGKQLHLFMNPVNAELMELEVSCPGYKANMAMVNHFMGDLTRRFGCRYADYSNAVPPEYFADHVHLTPDGYRRLAGELWSWIHGRTGEETTDPSPGLREG